MSFRAKVALVVNILMGALLAILFVTHATLVTLNRQENRGYAMKESHQYATVVIIMLVATMWWLIGRYRSRRTKIT